MIARTHFFHTFIYIYTDLSLLLERNLKLCIERNERMKERKLKLHYKCETETVYQPEIPIPSGFGHIKKALKLRGALGSLVAYPHK